MAAGQGVLLVPVDGRLVALDDRTAIPRAGLGLEIVSGPAGPQSETSATFTFASNGSGFTTRCRIDRQGWAACAGTVSYDELRDGPHVFEVETVDDQGAPIALAARGFSVATGRPSTTITSGPPALTRRARMCSGYCYSYDDPPVRFTTMNAVRSECRIDGGEWVPCSNEWSAGGATLAQGAHVVEIRSHNSVGVVETPPERHEWTIDSVAPRVAVTQRPPTPTASMSATVEFTADESDVTYECRLDSGTYEPCTSPYTRTVSTSGSHWVGIRATDRAGNRGEETRTDWTIEPDTEITEGPPAATPSTSASFRFRNPIGSAYDYHCRLDGGGWGSCSNPKTYTDLAPGDHVFEVKARSSSSGGVEDRTPATWSWTIVPDETPPETTITSSSSPGPGAARLHFSSSESDSTFACQVDGGSWHVCSSPTTYSALAGGEHRFAVRATDPSSNTDPTPATATVTVEEPPREEEQATEGPIAPAAGSRSAAVRPAPPSPASAPSPVAPVTSHTAPVTAARLRSALPASPRALVSALAESVATVDSRSFARDEELLVGFAPSKAGRLTVRLLARSRGRRVVVARGTKRFRAREAGFVAIRATSAGRRLLRRSARVRLTVEASFKPSRGRAARGRTRATMSRAKQR
jgi:hypothetical protein